jgi:hypothetical protein
MQRLSASGETFICNLAAAELSRSTPGPALNQHLNITKTAL